jgi:hypothetical protein
MASMSEVLEATWLSLPIKWQVVIESYHALLINQKIKIEK